MISWIEVDDNQYARPVREGRPDMPPVARGLSIYEVPSRIGISADPAKPTTLSIHFEYISDEPGVESTVDGHLTVVRGLHSGRLKKAMIDVSPLFQSGRPTPKQLGEYLAETLTHYLVRSARSRALGHQRSQLANQFMRDNASSLGGMALGSPIAVGAGAS